MSQNLFLAWLSAGAAACAVWAAAIRTPARQMLAEATAGGALAVLAYVAGAPLPLTGAFLLYALGHSVLVGERTAGWSAAALVALTLAAVSLVMLFLADGGGGPALAAEPARWIGVAAALAASVVLMIWLWRTGAPLRTLGGAQILASCAASAASFTMPHRLWPAIVGAALTPAAAALTGRGLVKTPGPSGAAFATGYAAQALILWAYLR